MVDLALPEKVPEMGGTDSASRAT
ncbi:MAG: Unknown protein, partial [uncultured Sulfurovum sp.]